MPPAKKESLGRQLLATLQDVDNLIEDTNHEERLEELNKVRTKLITRITQLIEANLDNASQEYRDATQSLRKASQACQDAIVGLESVANAITTIATAVDALSKLVAAV